jgi:Fe-S-cluster-containing dehydrogenase component
VKPSRRSVLGVLATSTALAATKAVPAQAAARMSSAPPDALGMLYDTTLCIGCKACVDACRVANDLEPNWDADRLHNAPVDLNGRTKNVIKLYKEGPYTSFVKSQCMHCVDPACAGACMLGSLHKDAVTGIVSYDATYCVGCRYCQMACPYNVAKFEFDKAAPKIVKCELCRHRFGEATLAASGGFSRFPKDHGPACCEVCPRGAVIYGKRTELLDEARRRIAANPGRYHQDKVYGEGDAGGTQVLYLSHVPFEKIGLPDIGPGRVPDTAYMVQEGLYRGFIAPVALYGVLAGVMLRNRKARRDDAAPAAKGGR